MRNELSAPQMRWLSESERWESFQTLWVEVKMLTGAILHEPPLLSVQLTMLETFIMSHEKYQRLTRNEIRHAFYMNAQGEFADQVPSGSGGMFRHYNKELNAEFIGDVLNAYVRRKARLYDQKHYAIAQAMAPAVEAPPVTAEHWQNLVEQDYQRYLREEYHLIFFGADKYLFVRRCGLIKFSSARKWRQWYAQALEIRERRARTAQVTKFSQRVEREKAVEMYEAIRRSGLIPVYEHKSVLHEMRKLVYDAFLQCCFDRGQSSIFSCSIENRQTKLKIQNNNS